MCTSVRQTDIAAANTLPRQLTASAVQPHQISHTNTPIQENSASQLHNSSVKMEINAQPQSLASSQGEGHKTFPALPYKDQVGQIMQLKAKNDHFPTDTNST